MSEPGTAQPPPMPALAQRVVELDEAVAWREALRERGRRVLHWIDDRAAALR